MASKVWLQKPVWMLAALGLGNVVLGAAAAGFNPAVLRFRAGELRQRVAVQEGDLEEDEQTELEELLQTHP